MDRADSCEVSSVGEVEPDDQTRGPADDGAGRKGEGVE